MEQQTVVKTAKLKPRNILPKGRKHIQIEYDKYEEVHRTKSVALRTFYALTGNEKFFDIDFGNGFDLTESKSLSSKDKKYQFKVYNFTCVSNKARTHTRYQLLIVAGVEIARMGPIIVETLGISNLFENPPSQKIFPWLHNRDNWHFLKNEIVV